MTLPSGTKLGPYEIKSPLGAGGMGEVYRAFDSRLDRTVAIKVLPANLSSDPNLRQRLDREARAVSKLSHPHICTLHDVGHQDGVDFLVMELVEGETLEQRLLKGALAPDQTLRYAAQIAAALAKAHKLGIVHRDLKPGNVMLTKTGAKLMDFGLAKDSGPAPLAAALTEMTMEQAKLTGEGTLIGTFQYMAPEQLEGKEADARADIFALGEVIYEMATGKPAFAGKSRASLIAAILTMEPPPMAALQPLTPTGLERVVKKCLAKDPDERWQSAGDLASELNWIAEAGTQTGESGLVSGRGAKWGRVGWIFAATFGLLTLATGAAWWKTTSRHAPPMYFQAAVPFAANAMSMAPDGRTLAMVAYSPQTNNYVLWTHEIGGQRADPVEGTQGASYPFWSPDGKFIGFFADGKVKKVSVTGGQAQIICDAPNGRGGTWNRDGTIVFAADALGALFRVSSWGGTPAALTTLDPSRVESSHRWPMFLPDGRHFIYLAANFSGAYQYNAIFLGDLDSKERRSLVSSSANAIFVEPGYLLYLRDRSLVAQPMDPRSNAVSGEPHILTDQVLYFPQVDRAVFTASSDVLVAQTGKGVSVSQLTWFDRSGKAVGNVGPPGSHDNVRLSPDGRRYATDQIDPDGRNIDIWIYEPARNASLRLTFNPALDQAPIWSPDGKQLLFSSNHTTGAPGAPAFRLFLQNADGSGTEQGLGSFTSNLANPWDWSRDGKHILFRRDAELWLMSLPDGAVTQMLQGAGTVKNAQFSPDARWIAYVSNETGSSEVYVTSFPVGSGKWQISGAGGEEPRWRADGKEMFYVSTDGKMMAVAVNTGGGFQAAAPVSLFQTHRRQPVSAQDFFSYDVSADGQRFLIATKLDESSAAPLSVVLNWASEMKK